VGQKLYKFVDWSRQTMQNSRRIFGLIEMHVTGKFDFLHVINEHFYRHACVTKWQLWSTNTVS